MRIAYILSAIVALTACPCEVVETEKASSAAAGNPPSSSPCAGNCPTEVPPDADTSLCRLQLCNPDTNGCDAWVSFPGASCGADAGTCNDVGECVVP
jgi:hypothetical protein